MTRRAVSRACGHRSTRRAWWHNGHWITWSHIARGQAGVGLLWDDHAARRCNDCSAWLPLGESNDAPDEVKVEMRAAMLAAAWEPENGVHGLTTGCEHTGWDGWPYRQPRCTDEHTGFLAAQIRNHERDLGEVNWAGQHMADHPIHNHDRITEHGND
jgi:hypothetical protein